MFALQNISQRAPELAENMENLAFNKHLKWLQLVLDSGLLPLSYYFLERFGGSGASCGFHRVPQRYQNTTRGQHLFEPLNISQSSAAWDVFLGERPVLTLYLYVKISTG